MFNKENNIKMINSIGGKIYQDNELLISASLVSMINRHHLNIETIEREEYQDKVTTYINKKHEYSIKKQYNPKIVNLYNKGILVLEKEEYPLKDFFIVFDDNTTDYYLKSKYDKFNTNTNYNKAVKFIDTTAFIDLIKSDDITIEDNKIILNNLELLNNVVKNWNGYLHSETKETDAIANKKMIKGDNNE